jgi:hypothetical protein
MATKAKRQPNKRKSKSTIFDEAFKLTFFDEAFKKVAAKPGRWIKTKIKIGAEGRKKRRV